MHASDAYMCFRKNAEKQFIAISYLSNGIEGPQQQMVAAKYVLQRCRLNHIHIERLNNSKTTEYARKHFRRMNVK